MNIKEMAMTLKLSYLRECSDELIKEAQQLNMGHEVFLTTFLERELYRRKDKDSIIITTNLTFERWEEIFKDTMLTGAIVDRLAHRAQILDLSREISYRMEDTIRRSQSL